MVCVSRLIVLFSWPLVVVEAHRRSYVSGSASLGIFLRISRPRIWDRLPWKRDASDDIETNFGQEDARFDIAIWRGRMRSTRTHACGHIQASPGSEYRLTRSGVSRNTRSYKLVREYARS